MKCRFQNYTITLLQFIKRTFKVLKSCKTKHDEYISEIKKNMVFKTLIFTDSQKCIFIKLVQ